MLTRTEEQRKIRSINRDLYHASLHGGENTVQNKPLEVYLEITTHCNIRCVFCAREHDLGYLSGQRVGNIASGLLSKVSHLLGTAEVICPLGFGEPFLHKEFLGIVESAKELGASIQFNTNGTLIFEDESRRLVKAGADIMVLSLDGAKKETFERIRKGASFETIVENMRRLHDIKVTEGTVFPEVYVEFVAMKSNFSELPELVDLSRSIGAVHLHVEPLVAHSPELKAERIFSYDEEPYRSLIHEARLRADRAKIRLIGRGISEDLPPLQDPDGAELENHETEERGQAPSGVTSKNEEPHRVDRRPPDRVVVESGEHDVPEPPLRAEEKRDGELSPEPIPVGSEGDPLDHVILGLDFAEESGASREGELDSDEGSQEIITSTDPVNLLCSQPFTTLYVGYKGRVGTCCLGNHELGDLAEQSVDEIWNGPKFQELRRAMRTGEVPLECRPCVLQNRIPPMRFNRETTDIVAPEITYEEAPKPAPVTDDLPLSLKIIDARYVPATDELYLKVAFTMGWDKSLHALVLVEAEEEDDPDRYRSLLPEATALFPADYDEVRSMRIIHGVRDAAGNFVRRVRITVQEEATRRTLVQQSAEVRGTS